MVYSFNTNKNLELVLYILQVTVVCNAIKLGWKVTKIGQKTYELSKKLCDLETLDLDHHINLIVF